MTFSRKLGILHIVNVDGRERNLEAFRSKNGSQIKGSKMQDGKIFSKAPARLRDERRPKVLAKPRESRPSAPKQQRHLLLALPLLPQLLPQETKAKMGEVHNSNAFTSFGKTRPQ